MTDSTLRVRTEGRRRRRFLVASPRPGESRRQPVPVAIRDGAADAGAVRRSVEARSPAARGLRALRTPASSPGRAVADALAAPRQAADSVLGAAWEARPPARSRKEERPTRTAAIGFAQRPAGAVAYLPPSAVALSARAARIGLIGNAAAQGRLVSPRGRSVSRPASPRARRRGRADARTSKEPGRRCASAGDPAEHDVAFLVTFRRVRPRPRAPGAGCGRRARHARPLVPSTATPPYDLARPVWPHLSPRSRDRHGSFAARSPRWSGRASRR